MSREISLDVYDEVVRKSGDIAGVEGEAAATVIYIRFNEAWDGYGKRITFLNARGLNAVTVILGVDRLVDMVSDTRYYYLPCPFEATQYKGRCSFIIEGYSTTQTSNIVMSVKSTLQVLKGSSAAFSDGGQVQDVVPSQALQLQSEIDSIVSDIADVSVLKDKLDGMTASVTGLEAGEAPTVEVDGTGNVYSLMFGIPAGAQGQSSYIHIRYSHILPPTELLTSPDDYIGIYTGFAEDAPAAWTAYTWYKFKGYDGDKGEKGDCGSNGRGITAAVKNGETVTLSYTDGTTDSFTVSDGSDGDERVYVGAGQPDDSKYVLWLDTDEEDLNVIKVTFQYSVDGLTAWHTIPADTDYFLRTSNDGGVTWGGHSLYHGADGDERVYVGGTEPDDSKKILWFDTAEQAPDLPSGGTTGQVLSKSSGSDYDYGWIDIGEVTMSKATTTVLGGIKVGGDLTIDANGVLSVDKATAVEEDNTKPITSAAVYTEVGNIEVLLAAL